MNATSSAPVRSTPVSRIDRAQQAEDANHIGALRGLKQDFKVQPQTSSSTAADVGRGSNTTTASDGSDASTLGSGDINGSLRVLVVTANDEIAAGKAVDAATVSKILDICTSVLTSALGTKASSFNKSQPGRGDHVDNPPSLTLRNLQASLAALTVVWQSCSPAQQKQLKPVMDRVHTKIAELTTQSKPPFAAAEQNVNLQERLGSRAPFNPASPPLDD